MGIDSWLDIIRREAQHVVELMEKKSTLVATAYNPDKHTVKGILVPSGVETGWVPIASHHIGNGWGVAMGPKVGDAKKLDGDQFDVEFEFGDPNTPVARHRVYSQPDKPPKVESGEIILRHEGGARIFFDKDKNLKVYGSKGDNQHVILNTDGSVEIKDNDGAFVLLKTGTILYQDKAGGQIYQDGTGKVFLADKNATAKVETDAGPSDWVFAKV